MHISLVQVFSELRVAGDYRERSCGSGAGCEPADASATGTILVDVQRSRAMLLCILFTRFHERTMFKVVGVDEGLLAVTLCRPGRRVVVANNA